MAAFKSSNMFNGRITSYNCLHSKLAVQRRIVLIYTSKQQRQENAITLIYAILLNGNMLNERFSQANT
jgi:hypothetical protein